MKFRVEFSRGARDDANSAYRWIAENLSPDRARRWFQGLFRQAETLTSHPLRCPLVPEADKFPNEVRELSYGRRGFRYRIIFEVRGDVVYVLHVRHASRDEIEPPAD